MHFETHLAKGRCTVSICYFHCSLRLHRIPSESFPVTSAALLKAIWQMGSHRAENGIFLGELKIMPTLFPSQLAFSWAGKEAWRGSCSALQNLAGCHFIQIGEKSEAQRGAVQSLPASHGEVLSLLPDPETVEGSFASHPPPSSCLERLASSPRSVLRTFHTQLISWTMPVSHLVAFPEAQKPTLGAKVLGSWMETEESLAPWTRKTTEGRTSLEVPMVNSQATQGRTPIQWTKTLEFQPIQGPGGPISQLVPTHPINK